MHVSGVTLGPFDPQHDLPRIRTWLDRPHVARWWGDPEAAFAALREHPPADAAVILLDAQPVGYLCWQNPPQEELVAAGLSDLPTGLVDVDIMIGEPDVLGHGVGPEALSLLLERLRAENVPIVGVGTASANHRALRAFEKAGFHLFRTFHEAGQEMRYLVTTAKAAV